MCLIFRWVKPAPFRIVPWQFRRIEATHIGTFKQFINPDLGFLNTIINGSVMFATETSTTRIITVVRHFGYLVFCVFFRHFSFPITNYFPVFSYQTRHKNPTTLPCFLFGPTPV